jgi:ribonucleoside-diphosphate reductase beta chain
MIIFEPTRTYHPFKAAWAMELAEEHSISLYWDKHQLEFTDDIRQYHSKDGLKTANVSHESNKNMLAKNLSVFTQSDVAVGELYCRLLPYVKNNEIRNWFMVAAARESTHQRCYAAAVEELGFPESTWGEFMEYKAMSDKIDLISAASEDLSKPINFAKTLAQLLLAEGIALFGAFASMLNLKRFGLMMGVNKINEWSLRDEERHVYGNILALNDVKSYLTDVELVELNEFIVEAVTRYRAAEHKFIELAYEMGPQEGMTEGDMKDYIDYLCDLRLERLGLDPIYGTKDNPLEWMDWLLTGRKHVNFFENRVSQYDHLGLIGGVEYDKYASYL